jgi:uncharacterized protein (DUF1330 family)
MIDTGDHLMPVYMLFIRETPVHDQAAMDIYRNMNRDSPLDPNLKPRVVYGAIEGVEGTPPDGMVMLEFPSKEAAKAWYNSSAYQAAIPHRQKAADYRAFIVEGL